MRQGRAFALVTTLLASLAYVACSTATPSAAPDASAPGADASAPAPDAPSTPFDGSLIAPEDATTGGPCEASTDCPSGLLCMYPLSEACNATGVCVVLAAGKCGGPYCTCRGDTTAACGDYGNEPMVMPLHGPPCGGAGDGGAADAGGTDGGGHD